MSTQTHVNNNDLEILIQKHIQQAEKGRKEHPPTSRYIKRLYPAKPTDIPYSQTLYTQLKNTQTFIPQFRTDLEIKPNALSKLPLIGKLIQSIQTQLHQIGLFYTNRALDHQQTMNHHLFACLEQLTIETQKQQRLISQLQTQINTLQEEPTP